MTDVLKLPVELVEEDCISCGVRFAWPKNLKDRRREDHKGFCCPNGHSMVFNSKTHKGRADAYEGVLERIAKLDVGIILNKHSLELAVELAKTVLKEQK